MLSGLSLSLLPAIAQEPVYITQGTAYDINTHQIIYREAYTAMNALGEVTVNYMDSQGKKIAAKTLSYQEVPYQPSFVFNDFRDEETISVQREQSRLVMSYQNTQSARQKIINDAEAMVVDAGFDAYIQLHWHELLKGNPLQFDFTLPTKLSHIQLNLEKINPKESPVYHQDMGSNWIYFRLQPAKKWISIFADPIHLAYDLNQKCLMRFYGRSNLDDAKGSPQDVRIEYQHF